MHHFIFELELREHGYKESLSYQQWPASAERRVLDLES